MKSNYAIFYKDHGIWRGPYDGIMYNSKEQAEEDCKVAKGSSRNDFTNQIFRGSLKSKIRIMKQIWVDVNLVPSLQLLIDYAKEEFKMI